jgi:hypothetical protein
MCAFSHHLVRGLGFVSFVSSSSQRLHRPFHNLSPRRVSRFRQCFLGWARFFNTAADGLGGPGRWLVKTAENLGKYLIML